MKNSVLLLAIMLPLLFTACKKDTDIVKVAVANNLPFDREEVVAVPLGQLSVILKNNPEKSLRIKQEGSAGYLPMQWIDYDGDGKADELLFMAAAAANSTAYYEIVADSVTTIPESKQIAYSRFVPERTDDYAWENDKVAFRTYGPKGQEEALRGVPGSTMSSGIDLWLKRVDYPIINKWYRGHVEAPGYYHTDRGEGYDPYHVGGSRGTGGTGIWENDSLYVSKNFTGYKTIASGPMRTVFELEYAPWSPYAVKETKRISLDAGSGFSKFEIILDTKQQVPNFAVGISLHDNKGEAKINSENGWFCHWEQIDNSHVGEGVVMAPGDVQQAFIHKTEVKDQSNLLILTKPAKRLVYYAGFAWDKTGRVHSVADWDAILDKQAEIVASPLKVSVVE